jgi:hypothetical protein
MPRLALSVDRPADRVLLAGLPHLVPVIEEISDGVLLIGGLATTAWVASSLMELPLRATRDVDLGIDRVALGLTGSTRRIGPLLERHEFERRAGDEPFRFRRTTDVGDFLVDLLLPKGASRAQPPMIEAGIDTVAAPGLAYAIARGPERLDLRLSERGRVHRFELPIAALDAMLVMKATLVADGARTQLDRRVVDTADAIMLAAALSHDAASLQALARNRTRGEPRRALRWLHEHFSDERSAEARRVESHFERERRGPGGAAWAVEAVAAFLAALDEQR